MIITDKELSVEVYPYCTGKCGIERATELTLKRARAKATGHYALADAMRAELAAEGILIEDLGVNRVRWTALR